jgi:hypothetical protein
VSSLSSIANSRYLSQIEQLRKERDAFQKVREEETFRFSFFLFSRLRSLSRSLLLLKSAMEFDVNIATLKAEMIQEHTMKGNRMDTIHQDSIFDRVYCFLIVFYRSIGVSSVGNGAREE